MTSNTFIGDVWVGIGPFKLQLTWPQSLSALVMMAFLTVFAVAAVVVALRNRGKTY